MVEILDMEFIAKDAPASAAPPQPAGANDRLPAGVLNQAEFEQEKARILNG